MMQANDGVSLISCGYTSIGICPAAVVQWVMFINACVQSLGVLRGSNLIYTTTRLFHICCLSNIHPYRRY